MQDVVDVKTRGKALFVDWLLGHIALAILIALAVGLLGYEKIERTHAQAIAGGGIVVAMFIYWVLVPYWFNGKTLGKKIYSIRIVDESDQRLKISQIIKRYFALFVTVTKFKPFVDWGADTDGRFAHDIISKTRVVSDASIPCN